MSEHNNALVRRFERAFAENDVATIDELCHQLGIMQQLGAIPTD